MYVDRDCKATSVVASAIRGCFVLGTARIKALGCLKKKKKKKNMKRKMTKLDFHRFQVRHSNNVYEQF